MTDAKAVEDLARRAVEEFGRIDVWVNNAAVNAFGRLEDVPLEDFRRVLDVNVMGYVHGARAALPVMRAQGRGKLVNISSIVGAVAQPYSHPYSMSKHAVQGFGSSLRQQFPRHEQPDVPPVPRHRLPTPGDNHLVPALPRVSPGQPVP